MSYVIRFPSRDKDFNTYVVGTKVYIIDPFNKPRLGIITADENIVTTDEDSWSKNYIKLIDPNQCTKAIRDEKKRLKKKIKKEYPIIFSKITDSILTSADRLALRMFLRNPASKITAATWCPIFLLLSMSHLLMKFKFINTDNPSSRKMPKGNRIFFESYIGLPDLADKDLVFSNGINISTAFFTLLFKDADAGKTLYARCYYENSKGERGPVSLIYKSIIP